jgi:hypothetical protein
MKCAVGTFARAICSSSAEVSTPVTSYLTSTRALVRAPHRSLHPLFPDICGGTPQAVHNLACCSAGDGFKCRGVNIRHIGLVQGLHPAVWLLDPMIRCKAFSMALAQSRKVALCSGEFQRSAQDLVHLLPALQCHI